MLPEVRLHPVVEIDPQHLGRVDAMIDDPAVGVVLVVIVNRELRIPDASEALLRDWEAHAANAARQGTHPFHAPGYGVLVGRIENHAKEAGRRMPAALAQVLDDHGPLVRSEREATKLADRLDAGMKKRDELLERAGDRLSSAARQST